MRPGSPRLARRTPSRNAVITGKYHWQLGPGANLWSSLPAEHDSYIHLLADNGYVIGQNKPKTWGPGRIQSWVEVHGEAPAGPTYDTLADFFEMTDDSVRQTRIGHHPTRRKDRT